MNSTGLELSQADLIRNFILMGLEPQLQTQLYTQYWRPIEKGFGQAAYANHFDAFMRHYLITKTGIFQMFGRYIVLSSNTHAISIRTSRSSLQISMPMLPTTVRWLWVPRNILA